MIEYDLALLEKITNVIDMHIRPSLKMDGGDISVLSMQGNVLFVRMHGACACCPRASETLKYGVEKTLQELVSTDIRVLAA